MGEASFLQTGRTWWLVKNRPIIAIRVRLGLWDCHGRSVSLTSTLKVLDLAAAVCAIGNRFTTVPPVSWRGSDARRERTTGALDRRLVHAARSQSGTLRRIDNWGTCPATRAEGDS